MTVIETYPKSAVDLSIGGMTCASCAARLEKKLNGIDGVTASVNFATETAHVEYPPGVPTSDLISAVEATGYTAVLPVGPVSPSVDGETSPTLERRLLVSVILSVPVMALAMVPALRFGTGTGAGWKWLAIALATPVITWCAWPFHRAAAVNLRHRAATMDTLISLGVLVSYGWSVWARCSRRTEMYFEVGTALTTFLLVGRYFEARAKRRAGSALRALLELGAKDVAVLARAVPGVRDRVPIGDLRVDDLFVVRPGEQVATDGVIASGTSAIDASLLTGESLPVDVSAGDAVPARPSMSAAGSWSGPPGSAPTPSSPASPGWSPQAQSGKAPVPRLADRVAGIFVPAVLLIAAGTFAGWLARRCGYRRGDDCRGRGPDRRVPLCARTGHADGAAGRYRPGRVARHRDPGPADPGSDPAHRHDRAGQDGYRYDRRDARGRRGPGRLDRAGRAVPARRGGRDGGPSTRSREPSWPPVLRRGIDYPRQTTSSRIPGLGARATVEGHHVTIGRYAYVAAGSAAVMRLRPRTTSWMPVPPSRSGGTASSAARITVTDDGPPDLGRRPIAMLRTLGPSTHPADWRHQVSRERSPRRSVSTT